MIASQSRTFITLTCFLLIKIKVSVYIPEGIRIFLCIRYTATINFVQLYTVKQYFEVTTQSPHSPKLRLHYITTMKEQVRFTVTNCWFC